MRTLIFTFSFFLTTSAFGCKCLYYDFSTLEDIERYKFIGLVKIDSIFLLPEDTVGRRISHRTSFSIIELYRGDSISELKVSGSNHNLNIQRWTSCDMNLNPEEEWVLFAYQLADSTFQTVVYFT